MLCVFNAYVLVLLVVDGLALCLVVLSGSCLRLSLVVSVWGWVVVDGVICFVWSRCWFEGACVCEFVCCFLFVCFFGVVFLCVGVVLSFVLGLLCVVSCDGLLWYLLLVSYFLLGVLY